MPAAGTPPVLSTARLRLRPLAAEDLPAFAAYRSDPAVARYQSWEAPFSLAAAERLVAGQAGVAWGDPGEWLQIAVLDRGTGALLGDCALHVLADARATAEVGVTLAPAHQGAGVGREALGALIAAAFATLGLHRVVAEVDERNRPAGALLEALGLRREGRLVEADWCKGEWVTLVRYAVLAREWRRAARRGRQWRSSSAST